MTGDNLVVTAGETDATGIKYIQAMAAAKYPRIHRTVPHNKELSTQNANFLVDDKPCPKVSNSVPEIFQLKNAN